MGTTRDTLAEGTKGAQQLGPKRARVYSDLSPEDKDRYNADIRATNILLQGLPKDIYTLINHYIDAKDIWDHVKMLLEGSELTKEDWESQQYDDFEHFRQNKGETIHDYYVWVDRIEVRGTMHGVQVQLDMGELKTELGMQIQVKQDRLSATTETENGVALDEEQLLFLADDSDAFDFDVDEAPTTQTMFMANLSSADPVYDEASSSYDSDILSEVHDHDHYQDAICEHHEVHEMHDDVQPNYVVDSHADYTSNSNMIPYDQYVKDNAVPVIQSNVSYVPNDAYMMILNDIYELSAQCVSVTTQNNVVDNSLTAELKTYKEQVELYERRAKFKLTEREQKINEQLRIVIADRNRSHQDESRSSQRADHSLRPIKALTVYPPNTPAKLVARMLPTKSQVKINIFAIIQLFSEFDKICQKRITPTGLTEGERGFEQTKECYLTELEVEVDHNVVNRNHDEIMRKNILIVNDNLIVDCLSKEVFYIATNSELTVSRFTEMHDAHTIVQTRCLELEAELSKLRDKVQKDDHTELVKRFSNLEITCAKHIDQTTALLTENENLKAQIHENMKYNTMESVKPRVLAPSRYAIYVEPIPPHNRNNKEVHLYYLKHLKESIKTLYKILKEAKVERPLDRSIVSSCRYTKHSQELLEYVIGTCPKAFNQQDKKHAPTPLIRKKQVNFDEQCDTSNSNTHKHVEELNTQKSNVLVPPSTGVNCCTNANGS
ncbi:hypothetical protein Tco_0745859 [Tanacetum coccineum]